MQLFLSAVVFLQYIILILY